MRRWRPLLLIVTLLVITIAGAASSLRYLQFYRHMMAGKDSLLAAQSALQTEGLNAQSSTLSTITPQIESASHSFQAADSIAANDPLLQIARRLPWLGSQAAAAQDLAAIGIEAAAIAASGAEVLHRVIAARNSEGGQLGEKALALLDEIRPHVHTMQQRLATVQQKRQRIEADGLLPPLATAVAELDERMRQVEASLATYSDVETLIPSFLGYDRPMTYLILTQDNTELFPTGGIISVYGLLTLDRGRITHLSFHDVTDLYHQWQNSTGEHVEPPGPLGRYLLRGWSWSLGGSNWSPDFPTAAQQAQWFLIKEGGQPVDGVIGMNFITLERLLEVLGPIAVPEYEVQVNAENATELILEQTHTPAALREGKQRFVARLAEKTVNALLTAQPSQWAPLLDTLQRLFEEKHLLLYVNDPDLQERAVRLGWAGEVRQTTGDYLMLVNASVNSTKLNMVLEESRELDIHIGENGDVTHRLTISYHNALPEWEQGKSPYLLQQMLDGFYGGYLRLLAPSDSYLVDLRLDGLTVGVEEILEEAGRVSFGRYFGLARGESAAVTFVYVSPAVVNADNGRYKYNLLVQKQPGTGAIPLQVRFHLPDGARLTATSLDGEALANAPLAFSTDLRTDRELSITFAR